MRPKTLPSQLNCLNYAENRRFVSFSVQKKKANVAFFRIKKPYSINIYMWDNSGAENRDFCHILDLILNMRLKDRKKSRVMYLKGNLPRILKMASDFS